MTLIHWPTQGMKNVIDAFGFEWWVAPGEAEAELAYLHKVGIIDAVLSDDSDVWATFSLVLPWSSESLSSRSLTLHRLVFS